MGIDPRFTVRNIDGYSFSLTEDRRCSSVLIHVLFKNLSWAPANLRRKRLAISKR